MIGEASAADVPRIVAMLRRYHADAGFAWPFDAALLSMTVSQCIADADRLCLVGTDSVLLAVAMDSPLGAGRIAVTLLLWCGRPGEAAGLIRAYEAWARRQGCASVAVSSRGQPDLFARLYRRHGFAPAEHTFAKVL